MFKHYLGLNQTKTE